MKTNDSLLFGRQLKKCRRLANVTQEDLAAYIDKDPSLISHYERGKGLPDKRRLEDMSRFLKKRGASEDCLEQLYEYGGYDIGKEFAGATIAQIMNILDDFNQESSTRAMFEEIIRSVVEDWKKYRNALRDLQRSYWEDAQEAFAELLSNLDQELPLRRRLRIRVSQDLANAWRYLGEPLMGLEHLDRAVELTEGMEETERETLARLLLNRGNFYRRLNAWDKAKSDYERSRRVFKKVERATSESQDQFVAIIERKLAGTLLFQGQALDALTHCKNSIRICRDIYDLEEESKGLQHRAWAQAMLGHWDEALKTHQEVIETLKSRGASPVLMAKSQRYLADTYRMCGLLDEAESAYNDALNYLQQHLKGEGGSRERLSRLWNDSSRERISLSS